MIRTSSLFGLTAAGIAAAVILSAPAAASEADAAPALCPRAPESANRVQPGVAASSKTEIVPLYVATTRPLVMLTIGGKTPLPVIFDTGTDENILDSGYASSAGLKIVGHSTVVDNGSCRTLEVPVASTPDPRISGVALDTKTVQLLDYRSGDEAGIFGPDSFGDRYVIVEAGLNRVRIIPKDSGFVPPGPGHPYKNNLPAVDVTIGGQHHVAMIDTGNDGLLGLGSGLMKTIPLKSPATVVGVVQSALAEREVMGGELAGSLVVGPYRLDGPDVEFGLPGTAANIGFAVIRHLTVVLDPGNRRAWVLDPSKEHPSWPEFTGRFGPRTIRLEKGKLIHQREGRPPFELKYLGADLFEMPATGDRIQFYRKNGRVVRLELITSDGQIAPADRTS